MTPTVSLREDRRLALELADAADEITTSRFGALDLRVDTKPDLTPVTDADTSVETVLRSLLHRSRPADSVLGEEYGGEPRSRAGNGSSIPSTAPRTSRAASPSGPPSSHCSRRRSRRRRCQRPALSRQWWAAEGSAHIAAWDPERNDRYMFPRSISCRRQVCRSPACPAGRTAESATGSSI